MQGAIVRLTTLLQAPRATLPHMAHHLVHGGRPWCPARVDRRAQGNPLPAVSELASEPLRAIFFFASGDVLRCTDILGCRVP